MGLAACARPTGPKAGTDVDLAGIHSQRPLHFADRLSQYHVQMVDLVLTGVYLSLDSRQRRFQQVFSPFLVPDRFENVSRGIPQIECGFGGGPAGAGWYREAPRRASRRRGEPRGASERRQARRETAADG